MNSNAHECMSQFKDMIETRDSVNPKRRGEHSATVKLHQNWSLQSSLAESELKNDMLHYFSFEPLSLYPLSFFWFSLHFYTVAIDTTVRYLKTLNNLHRAQCSIVHALYYLNLQFQSRGLSESAYSTDPNFFNEIFTADRFSYFLDAVCCKVLQYPVSEKAKTTIYNQVLNSNSLVPLMNFIADIKIPHRKMGC